MVCNRISVLRHHLFRENNRFSPVLQNDSFSVFGHCYSVKRVPISRTGQMLKPLWSPLSQGALFLFPRLLGTLLWHTTSPHYKGLYDESTSQKDSNQMVTPNYMKNYYNHPAVTPSVGRVVDPLESFKRRPSVLNKNSVLCVIIKINTVT